MSPFGRGFASPAGVLFVEDFDEEPAPEPVTIAVPSCTAQDIEDARHEGRAAGAEEARAEQQVIQAALCAAALATIGDALRTAREDAAAVAERVGGELAGAVLALLGAALPATASRLAPEEVAALLRALLPPLSHTPDIKLRVHPAVLGGLTAQLAAYPEISVQTDDALAECDVALTWQDGHARRDWAAIWAQLSTALAPFEFPAALPTATGG